MSLLSGMLSGIGAGLSGVGLMGMQDALEAKKERARLLKEKELAKYKSDLNTAGDIQVARIKAESQSLEARAKAAQERQRMQALQDAIGGATPSNAQDYAAIRDKLAAQGLVDLAGKYGAIATNLQQPSMKEPGATEKEIQSLIARGVPQDWAQDVAHGNVNVSVDQYGNTLLTSKATGEQKIIPAQKAGGQSTEIAPQQGAQTTAQGLPSAPSPDDGAMGAIEDATGPMNAVKDLLATTLGVFTDKPIYDDVVKAKQKIRLFNSALKQMFASDGKVSVYEQQLMDNFLVNPDAVFSDPQKAATDLRTIKEYLEQQQNLIQDSLNNSTITQKEAGRLNNRKASIERVLGLLGGESPQVHSSTQQAVSGENRFSQMPSEELRTIDMKALSNEELDALIAELKQRNG